MTASKIAHISVHPRLKKNDLERGEAYSVQVEFNRYQPSRETIVLLHGYLGSLEDWKPAFDKLHRKYNLIAVELRGHGDSDYPLDDDVSWSMSDIARDIVEVIQMIAPESQFSIMASSMSTAISLEIVRLYPELVKRMFLMAPTSKFSVPMWVKLILNIGKITPSKLVEGLVETVTSVVTRFADEHDKKFFEDGFSRFQKMEMEIHQKIFTETLAKWEVDSIGINHPIFIISGKQDKVVPHEDTLTLHQLLANSVMLTLEDAEHHIIRHQKDIVFDLIVQWMENTDYILQQRDYCEAELVEEDGKFRLDPNLIHHMDELAAYKIPVSGTSLNSGADIDPISSPHYVVR